MSVEANGTALPMSAHVRIPASEPPRLLVVVDTEEEFDWHASYSRANTSVSAVRSIGRVQQIFDRFGIAPTYVIDYPVATQPDGYEPLQEIHARQGCTIGAHLHPWVTPPFDEDVSAHNSFTLNLPAVLQRAKMQHLRDAVEERFGNAPRMFKAGRYGLGPSTVAILEELGFDTDGSVCPRFDYSAEGGPSFASYESSPFFLSERLLEVPCTVDYVGWAGPLRPMLHRAAASPGLAGFRAVGALARLRASNRIMLSPEGNTLEEMQALTAALIARGQRLLTLSFHSPSAAVGHTPYVRSQADLDRFVRTIEQFCEFFVTVTRGRPITSPEVRTWIQAFVEPIR